MTVVVHIDGLWRNNGRPNAQSSWGVYFGPGSRYNSSGKMDPSLPQTSSRAEIKALIQAIDMISDIAADDDEGQLVTIARVPTNSSRPCRLGWRVGSKPIAYLPVGRLWLILTSRGGFTRAWTRWSTETTEVSASTSGMFRERRTWRLMRLLTRPWMREIDW
jgi:hypothetical protein